MDELAFYLEDLKSRFNGIDKKNYYLSYSGGKDSHFLYWFIKEYLHDNQIEVVSVNTYMEHHEILHRIMKNADVVLYPKLKPFEIKEKYGSPCFSKWQDEMIERYQNGSRSKNTMESITGENRTKFKLSKLAKEMVLSGNLHKVSNKCCKVIKKDTLKEYENRSGRKAILGVRAEESMLRKSQYTSCFTKDKKFTPLHNLNDELLSSIYERYNIEIPKVYEHINRTGCMGCPYGRRNTEKELKLISENQRKFVINYFKESYDVLSVNYKEIQISLFDMED